MSDWSAFIGIGTMFASIVALVAMTTNKSKTCECDFCTTDEEE